MADAVLQAAAQEAGVHAADLMIRAFERHTWSDSCLGWGGPAEICAAVSDRGVAGSRYRWSAHLGLFATNDDGSQVRLAPAGVGAKPLGEN